MKKRTKMKKRLVRNTDEGLLGGVCAGIADYMDMDVTLVRLLWIVLSYALGVGIITYLIIWIIMPSD